MTNFIAQGAEAIIEKQGSKVIKSRVPKSYRYPALDDKLRSIRTRQEARLLDKASNIIPVPKLLQINEVVKQLVLENIAGKKLAENIDNIKNIKFVAKQIGSSIAKLHDADIIHGDLTTSNLILKGKIVYFIDFGLGFHSARIEDKAVDLYVLKQALEARHPKISNQAWKLILQGYKKSKNYYKAMKQLQKVEVRGRYKHQY